MAFTTLIMTRCLDLRSYISTSLPTPALAEPEPTLGAPRSIMSRKFSVQIFSSSLSSTILSPSLTNTIYHIAVSAYTDTNETAMTVIVSPTFSKSALRAMSLALALRTISSSFATFLDTTPWSSRSIQIRTEKPSSFLLTKTRNTLSLTTTTSGTTSTVVILRT